MSPPIRQTPLTLIAQELLSEKIRTSDTVIDATVGNGHDTCFLAETVGKTGHVYGFDIQQAALENTRQRLEEAGLAHRTTLIHAGHEHMLAYLPEASRGRVSAVMFNLGYLPGSDKQAITKPVTSRRALQAAAGLLTPGGVISILAYRGHQGGQEETREISRVLGELATKGFRIEHHESPGPVLFVASAPLSQDNPN